MHYRDDYTPPPAERRSRRRSAPYYPPQPAPRSFGAAYALIVLLFGVALLVLFWLNSRPITTASPAQPTANIALPTSGPAQLQHDAQAAPATAAEQQAQSAPVAQPAALAGAASQPARAFSPTDLGDVPAQPAPSSLSPEQQQASAESAEQNYLDSVNSTMNGAQRSVAEHDACWNAGGCGVPK